MALRKPRNNQQLIDDLVDARIAAGNILDSAEYQDSLLRRARLGTLPPAIEQMLWHYRYGKPVDRSEVTLNVNEDMSGMTHDDLVHRLDEIKAQAAATKALSEQDKPRTLSFPKALIPLSDTPVH